MLFVCVHLLESLLVCAALSDAALAQIVAFKLLLRILSAKSRFVIKAVVASLPWTWRNQNGFLSCLEWHIMSFLGSGAEAGGRQTQPRASITWPSGRRHLGTPILNIAFYFLLFFHFSPFFLGLAQVKVSKALIVNIFNKLVWISILREYLIFSPLPSKLFNFQKKLRSQRNPILNIILAHFFSFSDQLEYFKWLLFISS